MSEPLILRIVGLGFFAVLAHWTFQEFCKGYMTPVVPLRWREPRYIREERPKAFWAATIWNAFWATVFLWGALFADFQL